MTRISVEAQVTADHRIQLTLRDDFPTGPAKVTGEPVSMQPPSSPEAACPLGQRLRAIRSAALEKGVPVMTRDKVLAEARHRRGEPIEDE